MSEKVRLIRLGIVGCGDVTELRHLPALRHVCGVKVSALSDIDTARLERVAARFGVAARYTDYRELIENAEIDAVAVCVPPRLHTEAVLAALSAGKHVLIEKPLALSLEECDLLMAQAAAHASLKAMVGFNLRWHRFALAAKEIIRRGELGDIKLARTVFTSGVRLGDNFAEWRRSRQTGGGALFELGVHHFDLLRFLFEKDFEEVSASSLSQDETAIVAARMKDGPHVVSAFCEGTGENHELEIYGARGWLRVSFYRADGLERFGAKQYAGSLKSRLRGLARTLLEAPRIIRQARQGGDVPASYAEQWRHFIEAIALDSPVSCNLFDGRRALEVALAAWEATSTKQTVRLCQTTTVDRANDWRSRGIAHSGNA
ncbi:MAG TPA: Gfo/Idh/MocA family oxidoreductase [Pyrinomonadaceae bacterium]